MTSTRQSELIQYRIAVGSAAAVRVLMTWFLFHPHRSDNIDGDIKAGVVGLEVSQVEPSCYRTPSVCMNGVERAALSLVNGIAALEAQMWEIIPSAGNDSLITIAPSKHPESTHLTTDVAIPKFAGMSIPGVTSDRNTA